ncbi:molybdopterin cofactor-binding domain-containing protein [Parablastomonas sp. CN1-191]|uniref:molybdopterin cofactor-binding domain-containing protein n=1 Tax=Parablastomonas sp. CN1-191 TaxID=3400908 RepID=UPI003BF8D412
MKADRRAVLIGAGAAGALVIAWALTPRRFKPPVAPGPDDFAFDAWLRIGADGVTTLAVPALDMGQGDGSLLAQVVASELGADWRQIALEPALPSGAYANTALAARWSRLWMPAAPSWAADGDSVLARRWAEGHDFAVTAEGSTLAAWEDPARWAAASARTLLIAAAARRWGIDAQACDTAASHVVAGDRRLPFGTLAEEAAALTLPAEPVLRAPAAERPDGRRTAFPRLDLPAKARGTMQFAADVRLPDMAFAAIRWAPVGAVEGPPRADAGKARGLAGFGRVVTGPDWVAATGDTWWAAERALSAIAPVFTVGERADDVAIEAALEAALRRGAATRVGTLGDADAAAAPPFDLVARYSASAALHAGLETAAATAHWSGGKLELWVASQAPAATRDAVAAALGLSVGAVTLYPVAAGGSFDARLDTRHAVVAATVARDLGRPVQLAASRWEEHLGTLPRSPAYAVLAAKTSPDGTPTSWKTRIAVPSATAELGARLVGGQDRWSARAAQTSADPLATEGALPPYAVQDLVIEHVATGLPLPTGRLAGNAVGLTTFFTESFVDELAARSGREPLSFRMALLGDDVALAAVLQRAAALAGWDGGRGGQGLACAALRRFGRTGRMAVFATARQETTGIRVDKFAVVAQIGRVVNPDIAHQQIEGGLLFGLGLAAGAATGYGAGLPTRTRLAQLALPTAATAPAIAIEIVPATGEPFDPYELAVALAPPAMANALFAATGTRLRTLPLTGPA